MIQSPAAEHRSNNAPTRSVGGPDGLPGICAAIASRNGALPAGQYTAQGLIGGQNGATLTVGADGQIRGYVPLSGQLGPKESLVFDLVRR